VPVPRYITELKRQPIVRNRLKIQRRQIPIRTFSRGVRPLAVPAYNRPIAAVFQFDYHFHSKGRRAEILKPICRTPHRRAAAGVFDTPLVGLAGQPNPGGPYLRTIIVAPAVSCLPNTQMVAVAGDIRNVRIIYAVRSRMHYGAAGGASFKPPIGNRVRQSRHTHQTQNCRNDNTFFHISLLNE